MRRDEPLLEYRVYFVFLRQFFIFLGICKFIYNRMVDFKALIGRKFD